VVHSAKLRKRGIWNWEFGFAEKFYRYPFANKKLFIAAFLYSAPNYKLLIPNSVNLQVHGAVLVLTA